MTNIFKSFAKLLFVFTLCLGLVHAQSIHPNKTEKIELLLGINKEVQLDFAAHARNGINISNEAVVNYQYIPNKRELVFIPKKPGVSSVTVRNHVGDIKARYQIRVIANDNARIVQELKELLGDIEGIKITIKGGSVVIGGKIVLASDMGRINQVLRVKYKNQGILNFVEQSPHTQRYIGKKMQKEIQD